MKDKRVIIVTGRSGSGKRTALAAFEDAGCYCIDNMPVSILPIFMEMSAKEQNDFSRFVLGMDLRDAGFVENIDSIISELDGKGFVIQIIFLESDQKALIRRYNQTRRRHPMATDRPIHEAIAVEQALLKPIRKRADHIIDTTDLNVHELKAIIRKIGEVGTKYDPMRLQVMSFGFKFGLPLQADLVIDVRFLKNPYFDDSLRPLSGETEKIQSYVLNNEQTCLFLRKYFDLLDFLIPQYEEEGKSYLTIAIGCTGGRHRSVVVARRLCSHLRDRDIETELIHRDIDRVTSHEGAKSSCNSNISNER